VIVSSRSSLNLYRGIAWTNSNTLLTSPQPRTLIQSQILNEIHTNTIFPKSVQPNSPVGTRATIIEVSPRDELVFAYYPNRSNELGINTGTGFIYERKKGNGINEWILLSPFHFPTGDGVVAAKWLLQERQVSDCL